MTKEEFVTAMRQLKGATCQSDQWSEPKYDCPECKEGDMRENLLAGQVICTFPPIHVHFYKCDKCGFEDRIEI